MQVLLAHPGTQHAPRLARELDRRGLLGSYWTGLAFGENSPGARVAALTRGWPGLSGLTSRIIPGVNPRRVHRLALNEIRALVRLKSGGESQNVIHERNRRFQEKIPAASLQANAAVIGFDTSSWILAERANLLGKPFWLDRTIGHPAASAGLLADLRRDFPGWSEPLVPRPPAVVTAEAREHELAHRVVVGSGFARDTLLQNGVPAAKVRVNPYGVDWTRFARTERAATGDGKLRFLFVGSLLGRKGVPYLLEAWRRLGPVAAELWLAGSGAVDNNIDRELPGLRLLGRVPHSDIPALFAAADVFVLPSLFEGFSLTILEAVASGLPIIATPNTGAAEALRNPALGRLIPPGSVDELEAALRYYLANPPDHAAIRRLAAPLADIFSWEAYGDRWAALLAE
jgi:glycosyltransferase involved in cell wall biosynthesis